MIEAVSNTGYIDTVNVLDYGFVTLRNISGPTRRPDAFFDADDIDPANSARMSFANMDSGRTREQDLKLAEYLIKNLHTTPIEMIEIWVEMKMPIFVARQFVRHRTVTINEVSGRYVQLPAEWYVPTLSEVMFQAENKKQGGNKIDLDDVVQLHAAQKYRDSLNQACADSYARYQQAINDGIAMEQARCFLHLNHYTHWLWKQDLHNMMHFLSLRDHSHAQGESAQYARALDRLLRQHLPASMECYDKYRRRG